MLNSAVTITITRATTALTYAGYGTAMVLGCHKHWRDRIKYYAGVTGMLADGFLSTDPEYIWAQTYFSQQPHPAQVAIGRIQADDVDVTVDEDESSTTFTLLIDEFSYSMKTDPTGLATEVATAMEALLDATCDLPITGVGVAPANTLTIALDYTDNFAAGDKFTVAGSSDNDGVYTVVSAALVGTDTVISVTEAIGAVVDGNIFAINGITAVDTTAKTFGLAGDYSLTFIADYLFNIFGSANAGAYTTVSSSYSSGTDTTTIVVSEAIPDATVDGIIRPRVTLTAAAAVMGLAGVAANRYAVTPDSNMSMQVLDATEPSLEAIATCLANIELDDGDWYALATTFRDAATQLAVAVFAEANTKLGGVCSEDSNIPNTTEAADTTSIAYTLKNANYDRTWVFYHPDAADDNNLCDECPDAGWFGKLLAYEPGEATWVEWQLSGVAAYDLTTTQKNNIANKNCNLFEKQAGVYVTRVGKTAGGEYIDTIRGLDWIEGMLTTDLLGALINAKKIAYSDRGVSKIESPVRARLANASRAPHEILVGGTDADGNDNIQITVGKVASQTAANKAARIYPGISWVATLAGAIHEITVSGTVTP